MKSLKMRQAEYPLVGMAVKDSFKRDQTEFAKHYKTMDASYLTLFETSLAQVQAVHAASTGLAEQKEVSAKVYLLEEDLLRRTTFLKDYAADAAQDTTPAADTAKALRRGDTEAAVKALRQAATHYTPDIAAMQDMPQDFLTQISADTAELERMNNEQNTAMNFRPGLTEENRAKYDTLDACIAKVSNAGKRIFRGTAKADEYTISKILTRIRAAERKKEEETPKTEGQ